MSKIDLTTGRAVEVVRLNQWGTYEGLVEGLPTEEMNSRIVKATWEEARQLGNNLYLIEPTETPIDLGEHGDHFGKPAKLPGVICVALLNSDGPDPTTYSSLTVIWFQNAFAFPIEDAALRQIRTIAWEAKARVYDV